MIPLITALILALLSLIASAFVIFRIIIPILPPHPLSQRVPPSEFGLPRFRALSTANKGHIWLAASDLIALSTFVWQAVAEAKGAPLGFAAAIDPTSSIRIWIIMSLRQTCLLIITTIAFLYTRLGRSVSFGRAHWLLWAPTMLFVLISTAFAGAFSRAGIDSLFIGLAAYTSAVAILTTVVFACLIRALYNIKHNLAAIKEEIDPWPSVKQIEEKPRPSFATEEIKDRASWITSNPSSRRDSLSAWSFSTHLSSLPDKGSHSHEIIPPLPSPYGTRGSDVIICDNHHYRQRLDSQTSWLTSPNTSHTTVSAWSFPATLKEGNIGIRNLSAPDLLSPSTMSGSRPTTSALADAQVLGGYGYAPGSTQVEKGLKAIPACTSVTEIMTGHILSWLIAIWLPFGLSFPYLCLLSQQTSPNTIVSTLLILSITLSSPILALNIIFHHQLPISLFEPQDMLPAELIRGPSRMSTLPGYKHSYEYKRSMSTSPTVVGGRRSGDIWISYGDATDGKNKFDRAVEMLSARPKLFILPPEETREIIHPVLIRDEFLVGHNRSHSDTSAQFNRSKKESKGSSYLSGIDEDLLPLTPPKVHAARLPNEIDALTAGILPLLVPGLNVGGDIKIEEELPATWSKSKSYKTARKLYEFGEDFSSPESHSTPVQRHTCKEREQSNGMKHLSLPSPSLDKDDVHSLAIEIKKTCGQYTTVPGNLDIGKRNSVFSDDAVPNHKPVAHPHAEMEGHVAHPIVPLTCSMSMRSLGLQADVPHNIDEGRRSPSTVTLFEDLEPRFGCSPQAESTPHNAIVQKPKSKYPPPSLSFDTKSNATKSRSSIIYPI